jgi:hypothetical protein
MDDQVDASVEELRRSLRRAPLDEWPAMRVQIQTCRPELVAAFDHAVADVRDGWSADEVRVRVRSALVVAAAEILAAAGLLSDASTAARGPVGSGAEPVGVGERLARAAAALAGVESLQPESAGRSPV